MLMLAEIAPGRWGVHTEVGTENDTIPILTVRLSNVRSKFFSFGASHGSGHEIGGIDFLLFSFRELCCTLPALL